MISETYILGKNAIFFDRNVVNSLKDNMFWWRMSYRYQSIWRNLHIDGFEGYIWNRRELPRSQGISYHFFEYATSNSLAPKTWAGWPEGSEL